jgi:acyl-CoA hydrolase
VKVEIYIEQMYSNHRESDFWKLYFVALDENKKPIKNSR